MDKSKLIPWLLLAILILGGWAAYQAGNVRAQREIARIRADSAALHTELDAVRREVALRDSIVDEINAVETTLRGEAFALRDSIRAEESRREAQQIGVWTLRDTDSREALFRETFPQFAPTMRVTEYQRAPDELSIRYLMVPFGAAETFIEYKNRSDSFLEQVELFAQLDTVNMEVIELQDSIEVLQRMNQDALQMGMDTAFVRYQRLTQDYIAELERPTVNVEVPSYWYLIGGTVAGVVIGAAIR